MNWGKLLLRPPIPQDSKGRAQYDVAMARIEYTKLRKKIDRLGEPVKLEEIYFEGGSLLHRFSHVRAESDSVWKLKDGTLAHIVGTTAITYSPDKV